MLKLLSNTRRSMHFSGNTLDRQSQLRSSPSLIATQESATVVYLHKQQFLALNSQLLLLPWIPSESTGVYLGVDSVGMHYWALNVESPATAANLGSKGTWTPLRPACFSLPKFQASILAQASSITDWNSRHKFCPNCGQKVEIVDAGYKLKCTCTSTVQNYSYPRTDAVAIVLIASPDGSQCLLGRQKRFPTGMYSCIAGFIEPGETLEEACRREAKEETGVSISSIRYIQSQPWPFPSQLMMGCIATADSMDINQIDEELEDAQWFSREDVSGAVIGAGTSRLKIPPATAIAHSLIKYWLDHTHKSSI